MRIAVIGSGISGALAARLLSTQHEVELFEAASYLGGHAHTVDVQLAGRDYSVDTGFMVFNQAAYPNFTRLLEILHVPHRASDMSFGVRCERSGLEYRSTPAGLFAQATNLFRPTLYRMVRDIIRFHREAHRLLETTEDDRTLGELLAAGRYSRELTEYYLVPMGSAVWSAPPENFLDFPARHLALFLNNHGALQIFGRPVWQTIPGGSRRYVERLTAPLAGRIRLNTPIQSVSRHKDHIVVTPRGGPAECFDAVVLATHADQSLRLLSDASHAERELLGAIPFQANDAVLHTDTSLLPSRRRAWASWNYLVPREPGGPARVTYDLSRLQGIDSPEPLLLTLNARERIDPRRVLREFTYHHPQYSRAAFAAHARWPEINGVRRTWFCGAYWGYGFHEDGVASAIRVARQFNIGLEACTAHSTKARSAIVATAG